MPKPLPDYLGDEVINGRLMSVFSDGTLLPVVRGGADDGGAGGDGGSGDDGGSGSDDGGQGGGDGDGSGGAGDKQAVLADLAKERKARQTAEKERKALEERLAKLEEGTKSEHEKALEQARKEAGESARTETLTAANARIVRAEVKAAAGGKLADPNDAIRLLDLDEFEVDDEGNIDPKAISKAIDELVKSKPYLAANGGKRFQGGGDGGNQGGSGGDDKVAPGADRLRRAYADSSKK